MKTNRGVLVCMVCIAAIAPMIPAHAEIRYRIRRITFPSCFEPEITTPFDFNDRGQVCGYLDGCDIRLAKRWEPDTASLTDLGSLPGCNGPQDAGAYANAMNNLGHVVGLDAGPACRGESWFWTPETGMTILGDLPGGAYLADVRAVNDLDQAVGYSIGAAGAEAFRWDPQYGMIGLGDLPPFTLGSLARDANNLGWVVGKCSAGAFLWTEELGMKTLGELTNEPENPPDVNALNNVGQLAGTDLWGVYVWDFANGTQTIGVQFDGVYPHVSDINDRGHIVGYSHSDQHPMAPFVWDEHRGMRNVNDLLDPCRGYPFSYGVLGTSRIRINNHGQIMSLAWADIRGYILTPYIPGDLNEDEVCDLQDLAIQLSNFARTGDANYGAGDLDCDHDVDLEDLAILLGNFGETLP